MILYPFAEADDVAESWRPLTEDELYTANVLLVRASARIRAKVADIDHRIESGLLDRTLAVDVACAMVIRAMRNIDGIRDVSETVGGVVQRRAYMVDAASGHLEITEAELALLRPARRPARTIRVVPGLA